MSLPSLSTTMDRKMGKSAPTSGAHHHEANDALRIWLSGAGPGNISKESGVMGHVETCMGRSGGTDSIPSRLTSSSLLISNDQEFRTQVVNRIASPTLGSLLQGIRDETELGNGHLLYRYRKTTRHKLQPARTLLCWLVILLTETQQDFFLDFQHDARAIPHYETDCVFRRRA